MKELMIAWMNKWVNEQMNQETYEWINKIKSLNGRVNEWPGFKTLFNRPGYFKIYLNFDII